MSQNTIMMFLLGMLVTSVPPVVLIVDLCVFSDWEDKHQHIKEHKHAKKRFFIFDSVPNNIPINACDAWGGPIRKGKQSSTDLCLYWWQLLLHPVYLRAYRKAKEKLLASAPLRPQYRKGSQRSGLMFCDGNSATSNQSIECQCTKEHGRVPKEGSKDKHEGNKAKYNEKAYKEVTKTIINRLSINDIVIGDFPLKRTEICFYLDHMDNNMIPAIQSHKVTSTVYGTGGCKAASGEYEWTPGFYDKGEANDWRFSWISLPKKALSMRKPKIEITEIYNRDFCGGDSYKDWRPPLKKMSEEENKH